MSADSDSRPTAPPDPPGRMLERLLDLAQDASSYLRHHRDGAVRTAAALLLAASLAACKGSPVGTADQQDTIEPLSAEVRSGLPTGPGRYALDPASLRRDSQGIYYFAWSQPGGAWQQASASLLQLVQDQADELEVPAGGDPILHLREDTPVALADAPVAVATPVPGSSDSGPSTYTPWYPFYGVGSSSTPSYRNPPGTTDSSNVARGSDSSSTPPPPPARTSGLPHAVSGQGKGTGSGTAATGKSGASASSSSGQSGGTGGGDAASSKGSSSSGGGIGSARSGGFSGGGGSGGGSSSGGGSGS